MTIEPTVLTIIGWAVMGGIAFGASRAGSQAGLNGTRTRVVSLEGAQAISAKLQLHMSNEIAEMKSDIRWIIRNLESLNQEKSVPRYPKPTEEA